MIIVEAQKLIDIDDIIGKTIAWGKYPKHADEKDICKISEDYDGGYHLENITRDTTRWIPWSMIDTTVITKEEHPEYFL